MALHRPDSAFRRIAALHVHSHTRGDAGHLAAESWIEFPVRLPPALFEFFPLFSTTLVNHPATSNRHGDRKYHNENKYPRPIVTHEFGNRTLNGVAGRRGRCGNVGGGGG
jgi:hypothetical protein